MFTFINSRIFHEKLKQILEKVYYTASVYFYRMD